MRILLYSYYFPPEVNSIANRWGYFCSYLAQKGHQIYVVTSFPLTIKEFFKSNRIKKENYHNLIIIRVGRLMFQHSNFFTKWLTDLFFSLLSSSVISNLSLIDLVILTCPPYNYNFTLLRVIRKQNRSLILDFNELSLEPNLRTISKFSIKNFLLKKKINQLIQLAQAFLTSTNALKKYLAINFGISLNNIFYIPNGADIEFFNQEIDDSFLRRQYNLYNDFIVSYVGVLSETQNPFILIDTALLFKDYPQIKFLIVGTGPLEEKLKIKAKKLKLSNIIFTGLVPHHEVNKYIKLSDVCLVLLKEDETLIDNIPSKIFDYLAAKKPIIINLEGEASRLIQEARAGILIKPSSPDTLKEVILKLYQDKFLREKMGLDGYSYVINNFNQQDLSSKLEKTLYALIK